MLTDAATQASTKTAPNGADFPLEAVTRRITVLGATGSIGRSTLDLIAQARAAYGADAFPIQALVAGRDWRGLAELARAFRPAIAVVGEAAHGPALSDALAGAGIATAAGRAAVLEASDRPADWVMAAIVGAAGLEPVLRAVAHGGLVALANKEALVCAGDVVTAAVQAAGARLLPVDSEHNAIFQVLEADRPHRVEKLILTASGGPFRTARREDLAAVTPEQAVAHPNWDMGAKISVDSATMMNKGLELIEAKHLFSMPAEQLDVVVHPQSVIHSLVAYVDGSVLAQLGEPDMRVPIAHTLAWPDRMPTNSPRLSLASVSPLTFEEPDEARFPCLALAKQALAADDTAAAALNAANEVAVARFLDRQIGFLDIPKTVEGAMTAAVNRAAPGRPDGGLDTILQIDAAARQDAAQIANGLAG